MNKQGCGSLPVPGIPQGPLRSAPGAGSSWGSLALPAPPGGVPYAPSEEAAGKKPPGGSGRALRGRRGVLRLGVCVGGVCTRREAARMRQRWQLSGLSPTPRHRQVERPCRCLEFPGPRKLDH